MKYVVHVQRVIRLRQVRCHVLGPYRFKWWAEFVAWLQTINGDNVYQDGKVYVQGTEPKEPKEPT